MLIHWKIGFIVAFMLLWADKHKGPDRVLLLWNDYAPKWEFTEVCYFCWCFWLSLVLTFFYDYAFGNIIVGTVLARFLFTVIARK